MEEPRYITVIEPDAPPLDIDSTAHLLAYLITGGDYNAYLKKIADKRKTQPTEKE